MHPTIIDAASRTTMADKPKRKKWIKSAVPESHKGKFGAKAAAAGKSTAEYAAEKASAPGALGKEARLAQTFEKIRPKKGLHYANSSHKD
jgi:hypothetical protein